MAVRTEAQLETSIAADVADNTNMDISPQDVRTILLDMVDSLAFRTAITDAMIKAAYERNLDTNAFTNALLAKLNGVEDDATADQTGAEIKTAYEGEANTNAFTDAAQTKLNGIAANAEVNVQADWTEGDTSDDSYIHNKPTVPENYSDLGGTVPDGDIPATIARVASPAFTGDPTAPTPTVGDDDTSVATTEFVTAAIAAGAFASQADLDALEARVAALEAGPTPHTLTRYAALRPSGAMPGDFTAADFLGSAATSSTTGDITTPASSDDEVVGVAVPVSEGVLTAVAELTADGSVNQFADMIRSDFLPVSTDVGDQVTLNIDGSDHYVYCTSNTVRSVFLGVIGYRLTQG